MLSKQKKSGRWRGSPEQRLVAKRAIQRYNLFRHRRPKCEAARKSDGNPCQQIAMTNGRCYLHGGKTPAGNEWHLLQRAHDPKRAHRKIAKVDRASRKLAKRIARMTDDELKAYKEWRASHRPGPLSERERRRDEKRRNEETRKFLLRPERVETRPDVIELKRQLEAVQAELERRRQAALDRESEKTADPSAFESFDD